jgi:hypothetical protein
MANARIKKQKDNCKFVADFMNWGSPMNQIFVMDAVGKLAKLVAENKEQVRKDMAGHFVHPEAWIQCAEEWQRQYAENYKG